MESKEEKVELIQLAIQKLMEEQQREKKLISSAAVDNDDDVILSRLLSQLETFKGDGKLPQPEPPPANPEELPSAAVGVAESGGTAADGGNEEIIRELRKVKRQNFITHCLLSAMIVLTVVWQVSEVSLVLKLKDGLRHPLKSFGSVLTGMLKAPIANLQNGEKQSATKQIQTDGPSLPPFKIPELPHLELPLVSDSDTDED
ncbi:uncharacterized protein LOC130792038 isoform X1 [Actinidia eriantha]|uniref:uncharacterized protein LOC130792038 isoform X1 n=2 Tax=Actinidia eriantha TaxID=165200 RepID=UPI00258A432C|nr:uncharacterized protein LOC130792038 isoform X1 [Actinidia eriantha]